MKQMDFSKVLEKRGFYPKCLKMPFMACGIVVVILFFTAILLCSGGVVPDCCKNAAASVESSANNIKTPQDTQKTTQKDEQPKGTEKIRDDKVGATLTLGQKRPKEAWQIAQERFLTYNEAYQNYKRKESLFFDKNSSFLGAKQQENFARNLKEMMGDSNTSNTSNEGARLAIIFGYGCDLGDEKYNIYLIDKRINRVVEMIAKQYPNIKILSSNEGKATVASDEKTREYERRVDIYFY